MITTIISIFLVFIADIDAAEDRTRALAALHGTIENQPVRSRIADIERNSFDEEEDTCCASPHQIAIFGLCGVGCGGAAIMFLAPWPFSVLGGFMAGMSFPGSALVTARGSQAEATEIYGDLIR